MKFLVTAGPTREWIDPIRFITNRSSGKMGYALARAARARRHEVVLVSGPVVLPAPNGVDFVPIVTAAELLAALESRVAGCDALIMAAAPADWRPREISPHKLKKHTMSMTLDLVPVPDILVRLADRKGPRIFVGFAAEDRDVEAEARRKLVEKHLDLIVANDVSRPDSGFESDTNQVVLLDAAGKKEALPLLSKDEVAARVVKWVEANACRRASRL